MYPFSRFIRQCFEKREMLGLRTFIIVVYLDHLRVF